METTVVRGDPRELIAFALFEVGYRPRESLVVVCLDEDRRTTGAVARVDLPRALAHQAGVAERLVRFVARAGEDRAVLLVLSEEHDRRRRPPRPGRMPAMPWAALVEQLDARLAVRGVELVDALAVGSERYRSYGCDDPRCCPVEGRPLDLASTRTAALMVSLGRVLAGGEAELVADVEPAPVPEADGAGSPAPVPGTSLGTAAVRAAALARWRALLAAAGRGPDGPDGPDSDVTGVGDGEAGDLRWLADRLADVVFRDAVLLTLVPGSGRAPEQLLAGTAGHATGALFATAPDRALLERGRALLARAAREAPEGRRADALAVLAWMSWWQGSGARARLLAARALQDDPTHRMAGLVDQLLLHGVPPEWVPSRTRGATPGDETS